MADLDRITWELAIAEAGEGAPGLLSLLLHVGNPPGDDLRKAVAALLERRTPTKRPTRVPRFSPDKADQVRRIFRALTTADPDQPRKFPPFAPELARLLIAENLGASPETIRDVVERRKAYREH